MPKPSTSKRAAKKPKKTATHDEQVVKSGRGLNGLLKEKKIHAAIHSYNPMLFPESLVTKHGTLIRQVTTAMTGHQSGSGTAAAATAQKQARLQELVEAVRSIRTEVEIVADDDDELKGKVGIGMRLSDGVSQDAISIAALQQATFEETTLGARMRKAGISQKRIKALEALRRTVASAVTAQGNALGTKTGDGTTKAELVAQLGRMNTRALDVGALVFKDDPKTLVRFERFRVKRRKSGAKTPPADASTLPAPAKVP